MTQRQSEAFQRSLLTDPPQSEHLEIVGRYVPAVEDEQVGGDWYDAFTLPGGATAVVIGDVSGHDRNAAAAMAQFRNALRGVTHALDASPSAVLRALDAAAVDLIVDTLATAVLGRLEPPAADGGRTLRWCNAGHPPPILIRPDGTADLLHRSPELLLGIRPGTSRTDHSLELACGSTVVLYTDGLVERREECLGMGLERLRRTAERAAGLPLNELCELLLGNVDENAREDDVALLAIRLHAPGTTRAVSTGSSSRPL